MIRSIEITKQIIHNSNNQITIILPSFYFIFFLEKSTIPTVVQMRQTKMEYVDNCHNALTGPIKNEIDCPIGKISTIV